MPAWSTYSFMFGPLVALGVMAVMVLLLRWAFSRGGSLVADEPTAGRPDEYGLMVPVAGAQDYVRAEMQRRMLLDAGIRVNLVRTTEGPQLMVWQKDRDRALDLLSRAGG
ncbi:MAG: hypothetical protein MUE31_12850 [Candidatus Nanopelagicales bacterium]|nr:hypothetical protein [Candidatus Nanopelagicales bacterium]MCU0296444.1 hypothetical protein [Candidatus Nanopelagicales bacterium]